MSTLEKPRWLHAVMLASLVLTSAFTTPLQQGSNVLITQVDTTQFPRITVYVSVTDAAGEPIAINPALITLSENGSAVPVDEVRALGEGEVVTSALATLLVLDVSGSMNQSGKLEGAKAAARAYVEQLQPGDQAGVLAFNTSARLLQPLTADREALLQAIDGLRAGEDTAMYDALGKAVGILQPFSGRKAIIVLTDGMDNRSQLGPDEVLAQIGPGGLSISTIGLGDPAVQGVSLSGLDEAGLRSLATNAGGSYAFAEDPASLKSVYERYGRALHSEYALTYTTAAKLRDGLNRSLSVSLAGAAPAEGRYNPGGLVPEVARTDTWPMFFGLLILLLALLIAPGLIGRGLRAARGQKRGAGSRVRLVEKPKPRVRLR
jgi:VWFA-related protein